MIKMAPSQGPLGPAGRDSPGCKAVQAMKSATRVNIRFMSVSLSRRRPREGPLYRLFARPQPRLVFQRRGLLFCFYIFTILGPFGQVAYDEKNPVKTFAVALSVLSLLAVGSLLAQMVQSNRNYERSLAHVRFLAAHLGDMHRAASCS